MSQQTKKGLPTLFLPILGAASVISIAIIWLNLHISFLAIAVSLPLIAYYFIVKKSINDSDYNTVDSVYYFGFSLTIVTLATSAIIHFGLSSDIEDLQNLNLVFSQFGIGLLVTCLGLILRLSLLASMNKESQDEEQSIRHALIQDMVELREEITGFATELQDINANLKQQQKALNQDIIESLKIATTQFQQQCLDVQNNLIENQKQKNLELADYQSQLQKALFERMQDMSEDVYKNMQQANNSHISYVEKSQKHLIDLAKDVGQSLRDLEFDQVAQSAKKSVKLMSQAYENVHNQMHNFNDEMSNISRQYTDLHQQHQKQLHTTMQMTKASVDSVNDALIEVATKASAKMQKQIATSSASQQQHAG